MTMNDTPTTPKLALQITLAVGASAQAILQPVQDTDEAIALMRKLMKTQGFYMIGEDTSAPIMFHVRHVVMTQIVLLPEQPNAAPKLARVQ